MSSHPGNEQGGGKSQSGGCIDNDGSVLQDTPSANRNMMGSSGINLSINRDNRRKSVIRAETMISRNENSEQLASKNSINYGRAVSSYNLEKNDPAAKISK